MPEWILQLAGYLFAGGCAYGAIRTDLKALGEKASAAVHSAQRAHARLDDHVKDWHRGANA